MPNKVKLVTAYVDLNLTKRPSADFHALGNALIDAAWPCVRAFVSFPFDKCWLAQEAHFPAANPRAEDRFMNDTEHVRSNIIQHSPVQWLSLAAAEDPDTDVFVWMGYSILKQGDFTGKHITPQHITEFLDRVREYTFDDIPFPGITERRPLRVHGDNWRFCGSTIIAPRRFLPAIEHAYKFEAREFIRHHKCIPLDLAIWPAVEVCSGLPWRFYPAEYDHTQLTNFPC